MALKKYNPMTPGQRGLVHGRSVAPVERQAGQDADRRPDRQGRSQQHRARVTARRRGGGHKRAYRKVDFKRRKFDVPATVERLEYDPNRTAFIALIKYDDGEQAYILAPQRIAEGDKVVSGEHVDVKPGNAMPLPACRSARSSTMWR